MIPGVVLKLARTGWRFLRYETRNNTYLLPFVAAIVLFGSGVAMGLVHGHELQVARRE